jgi:hypothetical protein
MYVLSIFGAMGNVERTHLISSGHLWQPNYFSIRTSSNTVDHATNCASRVYILLYHVHWKLGRKRIAGTHNCFELNNFDEYQWYVRGELTTAIDMSSVRTLAFFTLIIGRIFRVETLGPVKVGAVIMR